MSRADRALIYAIGGVVGLLSGFGAGALVVGEPAPRVCLSCHRDVAVPTVAAAPVEPASTPAPVRPERPRVALTRPVPRPAPQTTVAAAQPPQEATESVAPTSSAAAPTTSPTSLQETPPVEPPATSDPPTEPGGVSTSGVLTSGEPPT